MKIFPFWNLTLTVHPLQCLYQVGKFSKVQLLDLLCEALDPQLLKPITSENSSRLQQEKGTSFSSSYELQYQFSSRKDGYIYQVIRKVRQVISFLQHELLQLFIRSSTANSKQSSRDYITTDLSFNFAYAFPEDGFSFSSKRHKQNLNQYWKYDFVTSRPKGNKSSKDSISKRNALMIEMENLDNLL